MYVNVPLKCLAMSNSNVNIQFLNWRSIFNIEKKKSSNFHSSSVQKKPSLDEKIL